MKTLFTIPSYSLAVLNKYVKVIAKMADVTDKQFFVVSDKKMSVYVTGRHSILTFSVDIDGFMSDVAEPFAALNYGKFVTTALQVAGEDAISVSFEDGGSRLLLRSVTSRSKVTLSCFDSVSDAEIASVKDEYESLFREHFASDVSEVVLSKGLLDFAKISSRFMKLTEKSNAVQVLGNSVKYADNTSIISFFDNVILTSGAPGPVTLHTLVLDLVLAAAGKNAKSIKYSKDGEFALFESGEADEMKFIVNLPPAQFDFPSEDETTALVALPNDCVRIKVRRDVFLEALSAFDGIFDSALWKWSNLNFTYSNDAPNQINLSHSDSNAEAERTIEVISAENLTESADVSFVFSSDFYRNVLGFGETVFDPNASPSDPNAVPAIALEDILTIEFSDAPFDEEHGLGVTITSADKSLTAIFAKFQE